MGDTQIGTRSFLKGIPKTVVGYQACLDRKKRAEAAADRGDLPAAVSLLRENLNWCQANLSKDPMHEMTLWHQESLATHLAQQGEFNEALVHIAEAYDNRNAVEPGGQDTANTLDQYAFVLAKLNQHHLAASKYRLVWEARKKALGEDNPLTLTTGFELACCWFNLGMSGTHREWNIERAKKLHQSILDARERETPPNILAIAMTREELAQDFLELGEYDKARDLASKNVGLLAPWKRRNNGRYPQDQINAVVQSTRQLLSDIDSKIAIRDQQARERRAQEQANLQRRRREMQERRESEELEKAKQESERLEKERLEMEELEKAKWESERLDKERLKMERLEMEELEKAQRESERLEMERLEMERFEMERLEMDRLKKERLERERAEKAKRQRQKREAELKEKKELERKEKEERVRKKRELEIQEQAKRRLERAQAAEDRRKRELQAEAAQTEAEQANQPAQVGGTKAGAPGASVALTTDADGRTLCPPPATTKSDQIMGAAEGDAQNTPKKINQGQFVEKNPETNQHPGRLAPAIETPSVIVRESRPESKQQRNVVPKISTDNSAFVASPSQSPTLHLQPGPPLGSSKQLGRSVSTSKLAGTPKASTPTRPSASNDKLGRRSSDPSLNGEKLSSAKPQPPKRTQSISDSRFETAEDRFNEQSVDRWFRDVRDINEIILDPFRRTAGKRVKVAILDTGVDMNHNIFKNKDIRKRIKKREDFVDGDGDTTDICGHGTHCVAVLNRVAPWADIYVARVAVGFEKGPDPDVVAKAIRRALGPKGEGDASKNWDVDILSLSLGFSGYNRAVRAALDDTTGRGNGKLVVAAASNSGGLRNIAFPASKTGVIAMFSASGNGIPSSFNPDSTKSDKKLTVLGEGVTSAWTTSAAAAKGGEAAMNQDATRRMTGTSVATPIAAGIMALILETAMIDIPDEEDTQKILEEVLPWLRGYEGMTAVLTDRAAMRNGYYNIVPHRLLDPKVPEDRRINRIANKLRDSLTDYFGDLRGGP